jgi:hypothetical protein
MVEENLAHDERPLELTASLSFSPRRKDGSKSKDRMTEERNSGERSASAERIAGDHQAETAEGLDG